MRRALLLIFISGAFCASAIRTTSLGQRIRENVSAVAAVAAGGVWNFFPPLALYPTAPCVALTPGESVGPWYCLNGDGGTPVGSLTFTATGSPTSFTGSICPSGDGCATIDTLETLDPATNYYKSQSSLSGTGDFTVCALLHASPNAAADRVVIEKNTSAGNDYDYAIYADWVSGTTFRWEFRVNTTVGGPWIVSYDRNIVIGAWNWVCGVFDSVGAGTSTLDLYVNGRAAPGRVTNANPTRIVGTTTHNIFYGGSGFITGLSDTRYGGGFYTETAAPFLVAARQVQLAEQVLGRHFYDAQGNPYVAARASRKFCAGTGHQYGNFVDIDEPCYFSGPLTLETLAINLLTHGRDINNGWTSGGAIVTGTGRRALDMTHTAAEFTFPFVDGGAAGAFIYQQSTSCDSVYCTCGVYARLVDAGTGTLYVNGGSANGIASDPPYALAACNLTLDAGYTLCSTVWHRATGQAQRCDIGMPPLGASAPRVVVELSMAQWEAQQNALTSPIDTTTTTLTRLPDFGYWDIDGGATGTQCMAADVTLLNGATTSQVYDILALQLGLSTGMGIDYPGALNGVHARFRTNDDPGWLMSIPNDFGSVHRAVLRTPSTGDATMQWGGNYATAVITPMTGTAARLVVGSVDGGTKGGVRLNNIEIGTTSTICASDAGFVTPQTATVYPLPVYLQLPASMMAYYTMDGGAQDSSTGTWNGTSTNMSYGPDAGLVALGANFTAASPKIAFSPALPLTSGSWTVSLWVRPTTNGGDRPLFGASGGNPGLYLKNNGTTDWFNGLSHLGTSTAPNGVWTNIITTYDGTVLRRYFNGVQDGAGATTAGYVSVAFVGFNGFAAYHNGAMDEIGVWVRVLESAEITYIVNAGAGHTYPFSP